MRNSTRKKARQNRKVWSVYEARVEDHFRNLYSKAKIRRNVKLVGHVSRQKRQIDLLITEIVAGFTLRIVVECKYFNRKVDLKIVDSFLGFLRDVKANKGVLITNKGLH